MGYPIHLLHRVYWAAVPDVSRICPCPVCARNIERTVDGGHIPMRLTFSRNAVLVHLRFERRTTHRDREAQVIAFLFEEADLDLYLKVAPTVFSYKDAFIIINYPSDEFASGLFHVTRVLRSRPTSTDGNVSASPVSTKSNATPEIYRRLVHNAQCAGLCGRGRRPSSHVATRLRTTLPSGKV